MAGSRLRHDLHQPSVLLFSVLTENISPDNIALYALVLVSRLDGLERCILGSSLVFVMGTLLQSSKHSGGRALDIALTTVLLAVAPPQAAGVFFLTHAERMWVGR
jgi:hypothetical protein